MNRLQIHMRAVAKRNAKLAAARRGEFKASTRTSRLPGAGRVITRNKPKRI